jgi:hypothetical protein
MSRLCVRPGCDRGAAARLTYDPVGCQVWLDDLGERIGRDTEICMLHAQRLVVPRGWQLSDRREDQPAEATTTAATAELFQALRQELAEPEPEPELESEAEPEPDELPEVLRATSPLLSRAFASTGHQRSVLTQRAPSAPGATDDDTRA